MQQEPIRILLADDNEDDRLFFKEALEEIKINTVVNMVIDGEDLMNYLDQNINQLPHILFLDLNMPLKTGMECLVEIKQLPHLMNIAIAIYSTSSSEKDIEEAFVKGANVYIKKPNDYSELKKRLEEVLTINWQYQTSGLNRDNFLLNV